MNKLQEEYFSDGENEELEYEDLIEKYHLDVVNNLDMNRQFIFSYLRSKNVIDEEDCEYVMNTAKTRKQKASLFLDMIKRKGDVGMKHFVDALEFEHPQLYRMFTGKEAAPVLVPPGQDLFEKAGLPAKEYIDLDRELLAQQLEQTVKILHQKARLVNKLQDEKNVLEKKLFEANESSKSLQEYVELIKGELDRSSEIKQEASSENNKDHSMQSLQQEVMRQMSVIIALQGKLLAQTEQMEGMKTEILELKAKSNSWKQEVYELHLQCDNERRQSKRLNEQVILNQSCDPSKEEKLRKENLELKMQIGRLKEENETQKEDLAEFRKYGEVLNAKFNIVSQERYELQEQNDELSHNQKMYFKQMDEMEGKTKSMQRDYEYLKKINERYLSDIKEYRNIQQKLYSDLEALNDEVLNLKKRNEDLETSINKHYSLNRVLEEKYKSATNEIEKLGEQLYDANKELRSSSRASSLNIDTDHCSSKFEARCGPQSDENDDIYSTCRIRSNRELLDSIKKKVISPCHSPIGPPTLNSLLVPSSTLPKLKGLLTYEQLGLLFPPDIAAAAMATYNWENNTKNNENTSREEKGLQKLKFTSQNNKPRLSEANESIISGPLSANVLKNGSQPFLFDKPDDLFQRNEDDLENSIDNEPAKENSVLLEPNDSCPSSKPKSLEKGFRRRTQQVNIEHLMANNRRRLSNTNLGPRNTSES